MFGETDAMWDLLDHVESQYMRLEKWEALHKQTLAAPDMNIVTKCGTRSSDGVWDAWTTDIPTIKGHDGPLCKRCFPNATT